MITICYGPNFQVISDFGIDDEVDKLVKAAGDVVYETSTFIMVDAIRAAIVNNKLDASNVEFKFGDVTLKVDKYAVFVGDVPDNFEAPNSKYLLQIIRGRATKYNQEYTQ